MATETGAILRDLRERLRGAMCRDRPRLQRRLAALARSPDPAALHALREQIERSCARADARRARLPAPAYPAELPISARRDEIVRAIRDHPVVIVCGETGSGKSTQLPRMCVEAGCGATGMIGHTQPRRLAARSIAARIAEEIGSPLGDLVGYKVRFTDRTSPGAIIKVMTDGVLLAETPGDPDLLRYDAIIIDEAHERSLNVDFLLGYLRRLIDRRPELRVVITSATIDPQRFAAHFAGPRGPAPIIEVSGRTYPVEVRYRPVEAREDGDAQIAAIVDAVEELAALGPGDVLVFLPGEREIRDAARALRQRHPPETEILPLYARLSMEEQLRVFRAHPGRRIVLATNVAETSLTVPGVRYVVDPGWARVSRYSVRSRVQGLAIEAVSRASADQRTGRCGRVADGVCVRLYSEEDYRGRDALTDPEILRTSLATVILRMRALRLGPISSFPLVDPPDRRRVEEGEATLVELGAVDERGGLTPIGRELAALPVDVRVGRICVAAREAGCARRVLPIAAALSIQDPRDRPLEKRDEADRAHARFRHERSDFLSLLNIWDAYHEEWERTSSRRVRRWCRDHFLSPVRMREWSDTHRQLRELLAGEGRGSRASAARRAPEAAATTEDEYARIHQALLAGLLSSVGTRADENEYAGTGGTRFAIGPGSTLARSRPRWIVAAELVRTTRLLARTAAAVDARWVERVGSHLAVRTHTDPHYRAETGRVMAMERVTVLGLEVVSRRAVEFGPIDPARAREIFIHHALVEGEHRTDAAWCRHNESVMAEARRLEAKVRRHDLIADAEARFRFFDRRLPPEVWSVQRFESWRREAERRDPRALWLSLEDVVPPDAAAGVDHAAFPDRVEFAGERLRVDYKFEHGAADDGVTVVVPVEMLGEVEGLALERQVGGLMAERARALVRALPRSVRRLVSEEQVRECLEGLRAGAGGDVLGALASALGARVGCDIPAEAWRAGLPEHLRLNYRVVDGGGREVGCGRDLAALRDALRASVRASLSRAAGEWSRDGVREWEWDELPERVEVRAGERTAWGYPALVAGDQGVALRLLDEPGEAHRATRAGVRRLLAMRCEPDLRRLLDGRDEVERLVVCLSTMMRGERTRRDLGELVVERALLAGVAEVRTRAAFEACAARGWESLARAAEEVVPVAASIAECAHGVRLGLEEVRAGTAARADMESQLAALVGPGFLLQTPGAWLVHVPRFLRAMEARISRLAAGGGARDSAAMEAILPLAREWARLAREATGEARERAERFRWLLEELRVSLFAQELGTSERVSPVRLKRYLEGMA